MFKRLIFAVFVLGLILTLSGTAISGIGDKKEGLNPVPSVNPSGHLYGQAVDNGYPATSTYRPPQGWQPRPFALGGGSSATPPSGYYCDTSSYWCDTSAYVYIWAAPGDGFDIAASRFTVEGLQVCTLMVGWVRILSHPAYMAGTPDIRVYLFADDGFGFPGAKLDSVTFPYNPVWETHTWTWLGADWPTMGNNNGGAYWVFGDGDEYHIGAAMVGDGPAGDTAYFATDQANEWPSSGDCRSTVYDGSAWGTMCDVYGDDYRWLMESEFCGYEVPFSDCYDKDYASDAYYIWAAPHYTYGFSEWAERFSVTGPETLSAVQVGVYYDPTPNIPTYVAGNDDIIIKVYADNGSGLPDVSQLLATETIPGGTYPFYPSMAYADFSSHNLVFTNDFHIAFGTSGVAGVDYEWLIGDNVGSPTGRGSVKDDPGYVDPGNFVSMIDMYGLDVDFHISGHLCIDPYSDCNTFNYSTGTNYWWDLPDVYGTTAQAQRIKALGEECRVGEVSFWLYDDGTPGAYTTNSKVSIYLESLGKPALEVASLILTPSDYVMYPAKTTVDFFPEEVFITDNYYWIAIQSLGSLTNGIRTLTDFGGSGKHYWMAEYFNGAWGYMSDDWLGVPTDIAMNAEAKHCCIPLPVWACNETPSQDWATSGFDEARSDHGQVPFGNPAADLTKNWDYEHPSQSAPFGDPVVYHGKVVQAFTTEYKVFDLESGPPELYTINQASGLYIPNAIRCTPLCATIGSEDVIFLTSGSGQGIYRFNLTTGAMDWAYDLVHGGALQGNVRYTTFQLMNISGTNVLFFGTDAGKVVALNAATGTLWGGWTVNPVLLDHGVNQSGATDGANLFYCTEAGGFDCNVYSIRAFDGHVNWNLAGGPDGLQADDLYPTSAVSGEVFRSAVSYDKNIVYANSYVSAGDHPADGVFYAINAADGSVKYAVASARSMFTTPALDQNNVYMAFYSRWVTPPIGANLVAFNKANGNVNWRFTHPNDDGYYADMAITCETDDPTITPDLIFIGGHKGFLSCLDASNGNELFHRTINFGDPFNSMWNGMAVVAGDGVDYAHHLVASSYWGGVFVLSTDMAKTVRPRLEIESYNPKNAVEFGPATSYPVNLGNLLTNTGGANLIINDIATDDACFAYHPEYSSVRPGVLDNANTIADYLTDNFAVKGPQLNDAVDEVASVREGHGDRVLNAGATARPAFIQTATDPDGILWPADGYVLAAGETTYVEVDINQSLVNRGPQYFSMHVNSNDPDFYLNSSMNGIDPCIWVTIVGGCLIDTTALHFGMGCGNTQTVYNTGRICTGDDWATPWGFDIDGFDQEMFQGSFIYAISPYRLALNTQAWHGAGESDSYISLQADPNAYDGSCKAALVEDTLVSCGATYWNGTDYEPIYGNVVFKNYIDSVQNFFDGSSWDWTWFEAPFDNDSTMGLYVKTRTIGVCDFAPLKDVTIEIFEVTERNGSPVNNWKFGAAMDYDCGSDLVNMSAPISAGWDYNAAKTTAWGMIKLPYGCNILPPSANYTTTMDPFVSARKLYGYSAWWNDIYLDSAWTFLNMTGASAQSSAAGGDEECHFTIVGHNFTGHETFTFAVAQFGMHNLADASSPDEFAGLSKLINQFVGFGRGDVNGDAVVDLRDIVYLKNYLYGFGPGPTPFLHIGDVNADGTVDNGDVTYLFNWYFMGGNCPLGDWCF